MKSVGKFTKSTQYELEILREVDKWMRFYNVDNFNDAINLLLKGGLTLQYPIGNKGGGVSHSKLETVESGEKKAKPLAGDEIGRK